MEMNESMTTTKELNTINEKETIAQLVILYQLDGSIVMVTVIVDVLTLCLQAYVKGIVFFVHGVRSSTVYKDSKETYTYTLIRLCSACNDDLLTYIYINIYI